MTAPLFREGALWDCYRAMAGDGGRCDYSGPTRVRRQSLSGHREKSYLEMHRGARSTGYRNEWLRMRSSVRALASCRALGGLVAVE